MKSLIPAFLFLAFPFLTIAEEPILPIDKVPRKPTVNLVTALKIAQDYAKAEKMDLSNHYLDSVRLISKDDSLKSHWQVTWRPKQRFTIGGEIWMSVSSTDKTLLPNVEYGK